ncbi:MAG: hypothetical protein ACXVCX_17890, partial [Ktedonobacterales bacterium]
LDASLDGEMLPECLPILCRLGKLAVETAPEGGLRAAAKSASADWDQAEWYVTSVAPSYIRVGRGLLLVE